MSSTRHATNSERRSQERYLSDPDFVENRGLLGNIVAAKAQLYSAAKYRRMLFSLQALSMEFGGMRAIAQELLDMFPERLGTPTMFKLRAKRFSLSEIEQIKGELAIASSTYSDLQKQDCGLSLARYLASGVCDEPSIPGRVADSVAAAERGSRSYFQRQCRPAARHFDRFLTELCINPSLDLQEMDESKWAADATYFYDPIGAIFEYLDRRVAAASLGHVTTSIGCEVHELLEHAHTTGRMVIIEGVSGSGKTFEAEHYCGTHLGEVRFVTLAGITHRTGFFQKVAAALGLSTCQQASSKLQARVEAHLARTKLMLVIDEAHFLWPQHKRTHSAPELIDWVNTMVNAGVPIAQICTDQFAKKRAHVEKQTGWTSDQLMHRTSRYRKLPSEPTEDDLMNVAQALLSYRFGADREAWLFDSSVQPDRAGVGKVALYAADNPLPLGAIRSIVDDARRRARQGGRPIVGRADIKAAVEAQESSDLAIRGAFSNGATERGRAGRSTGNRRHFSDRSIGDKSELSHEQMSDFSTAAAEFPLTHPRLAQKLNGVV